MVRPHLVSYLVSYNLFDNIILLYEFLKITFNNLKCFVNAVADAIQPIAYIRSSAGPQNQMTTNDRTENLLASVTL